MEEVKHCPFCAEQILAAAVRCKHCNSDIGIGDVLGRHKAETSSPTSPIVRYGGAFIGVSLVAAIVGIFMQHPAGNDAPNPAVPSAVTAPIAPDPPLTQADKLDAFNTYVSSVQAKLTATEVLGTTWMGRIQQDIQFSNLEAYRKDAADLKNATLQASSEIDSIPIPDNISDDDATYFGGVQEAAAALISTQVDLAVDVAVGADTGINALDEVPELAQKAKIARKALKAAVFKGFSHFGASSDRVNPSTLTLMQ